MTAVAFQLPSDVRFKKFCLSCERGLKYFFIVKLSDRIFLLFIWISIIAYARKFYGCKRIETLHGATRKLLS